MSPPDLTTSIALQEIKEKLERIEGWLEAIAAAVEAPTPSEEAGGDPCQTEHS